jgi:hypothetical protein
MARRPVVLIVNFSDLFKILPSILNLIVSITQIARERTKVVIFVSKPQNKNKIKIKYSFRLHTCLKK